MWRRWKDAIGKKRLKSARAGTINSRHDQSITQLINNRKNPKTQWISNQTKTIQPNCELIL